MTAGAVDQVRARGCLVANAAHAVTVAMEGCESLQAASSAQLMGPQCPQKLLEVVGAQMSHAYGGCRMKSV